MPALEALVVGSSGHAASVIDVVERTGLYRIAGLLDRFEAPGSERLGYTILGGEDDIGRIIQQRSVQAVFVAVGDNWGRSLSVARLRERIAELEFPWAVHPAATLGKGVRVGAGTVVMAGAIVNAGSQIGGFCIVNTSASVDHECALADYASIGPGATLGGRVKVGRFSAVGLGANVVQKVSIGDHAVLGAGATLLKDLPDNVVAYGVPARVMRRRETGERYL